ncbi:hypothetical protein Scep_000418 [Stephania cephalantha]|uniref:Uncharacterized protein n=1 Tax=Stephania cephalantha TaxID=152367 RepID=A0AAP0L7J9_9MAGN
MFTPYGAGERGTTIADDIPKNLLSILYRSSTLTPPSPSSSHTQWNERKREQKKKGVIYGVVVVVVVGDDRRRGDRREDDKRREERHWEMQQNPAHCAAEADAPAVAQQGLHGGGPDPVRRAGGTRGAEEEYGFANHGPLAIPCDESVFEEILRFLSRSDSAHSSGWTANPEDFQRGFRENWAKAVKPILTRWSHKLDSAELALELWLRIISGDGKKGVLYRVVPSSNRRKS